MYGLTLKKPLAIAMSSAFLSVGTALAQSSQAKAPPQIFSRNSPAIVTISTTSALGSGVLIDSTGVIVSNFHVIDGSSDAVVRLASGEEYDDVAVVDFDTKKDIVLLKIKGFGLPFVEFGNSDTLKVGSTVFAIGAPQGFDLTMSQGIVSGLRTMDGARVVQTTAAISHGSSGGGLFDDRGRLIGITSFKVESGENLNFAVPVNYIRGMFSVAPRLTLRELAAAETRSVKVTPPPSPTSSAPVPQGPMKVDVEGLDEAGVIRLLGRPSLAQKDLDGITTWYYDTPNGTLKVFFMINGRASRIR